jgi:hypothetical protein
MRRVTYFNFPKELYLSREQFHNNYLHSCMVISHHFLRAETITKQNPHNNNNNDFNIMLHVLYKANKKNRFQI